MRFDSRDLTVKLMADAQPKAPGCKGCTDTQDDQGDNCNDCTLTQDQPTNDNCPRAGDDEVRRSQAALTALRQQLREALSQPG